MSVIVFAGPSLRQEDHEQYSSFSFLPPVAQGDLYRAAQARRPEAIGIIDGYFDGMPAVWHKEILWALDRGIAVLGAASMGALRGAELHAFGMRGIGSIFEDYRDEVLTDDDEVALVHGPAEAGFVALSEPMVNIRATVKKAGSCGILDDQMSEKLIGIAKAQFYQDRTWKSVLAAAAGILDPDPLTTFSEWLPDNKIDQKRLDALALLEALSSKETRSSSIDRDWYFEWTDMWQEVSWRKKGQGISAPPSQMKKATAVLNELRLDPTLFRTTMDRALLRRLVNDPSNVATGGPDQKAVCQYMSVFRQERGLFNRQSLNDWLEENDLEPDRFEHLMTEAAMIEHQRSVSLETLERDLLEQTKLDGRYTGLLAQAQKKAELLKRYQAERQATPPVLALLSWYFVARLKAGIPDDLERYSMGLGFEDLRQFYALLGDEYLWQSLSSKDASNDRIVTAAGT